ncbi:MAG TPA: amino acid adenylation domain-containing protein, partial [Thermoanaerobaculia bacterium]|nr:amino acid adenylation domain-containing protein [Thermoanaerobaculia bacterium]
MMVVSSEQFPLTASAAQAPALDLPADRSRPAQSSGERAVAHRRAGEAAGEMTSDPAAVCAAFATLLARTAGQGSFRFAVESGGERHPCAVDLDLQEGFGSFAGRLRDGLAALPAPVAAIRVGDGDGGGAGAESPDLRLALDGGELRLEADADRFDADTVERLLGRLVRLLAAGSEAPGRSLADLPCWTADEERSIRGEWSDGGPRSGAVARLDELFAARAGADPEATALLWEEESWSYADLARRAGAIARRLRGLGVGPGVRVGIFLDRRPDLLATILGTLRAGGTYVPLDPAYPQDRVAFMLADSGAAVVVSRDELAGRLPEGDAVRLSVDAVGDEGDEAPAPHGGDADQVAYLIYTSGSTGRPKGVAISHASAAAMVGWAAATFPAGDLAGVLCSTSVCFDLSVYEIFLPLATGGAVVLAADALALPRLPAARRVTMVNTVPSAMEQLLRDAALPSTVRTVNLAGEPLQRELVERIYATGLVERVYNLYGPSEDTTYSTWEKVPRGAGLPVTIGVPVDGSRAWVVDRGLRPVGIGVPGELLLGGAGVARGYHQRPGLTAGRFVPDPFGPDVGGRLYRTGDLVRWRDDGRLDFLGRIDHQVKVRGFRIELGEIEAGLEAEDGVRQSVVVVRRSSGADGEPQIVAYWVPERADGGEPNAEAVSAETLRAALAERMPAYMLPSHLVRLEEMPLTPNGKVDRKALPEPAASRPDLEVAYAAPKSEIEKQLAELWGELLGIDRVGIDDDLLALGGHSLLAARIAARVGRLEGLAGGEEQGRAALQVVDVLTHPTVRQLAAHLEARRAGGGAPALPPLVPADRPEHLPLSFQQEQVWFINQLAPNNLAYNFQYTVRLRGALDLDLLNDTFTEVVRRHEVLQTVFVDEGHGPEMKILEPWRVQVPVVDVSGLPAARREAEAERVAHRRLRVWFDVSQLPLMDWTVVRLAADDHLMMQAEQHFVHDGWSIAVLMRELVEIYSALAQGKPCPLPELPVQFADFALWQRESLSGEVLETQLDYWRTAIADPPPPLDLATDRPRPHEQSFVGDRLDVELPPELYQRMRDMGRREGVTLFVTLTSAFQTLMTLYTGQTDFLLGSGVANRRTRASEPLIGMIVNTLVLRADTSGGPTYRDLLARVRERSLGMQAHPDLPLEKLVEELQPDRDLSRNPLFQVMFSFHDAPVPDLELADGRGGRILGELVERHNGSAKSDLNVIVKPRAEQRAGREASQEDQVLKMLWEFATDLFDRATIERMWRHYLAVLDQVADEPGIALADVSLLGDAERRQLVTGSDAAPPALAVGAPIPQRLAEQVAAAPSAPAVVGADGTSFTYGELSAFADAVAGRLAALGVGRGDRVAVFAARTPRAVAALAGIHRAGAAYVPIDPLYPADRVAWMIADSGARAVVTDPATGAALAAGDVPVVDLDGVEPGGAPVAPIELLADDLAYVIYTSGSTGRPKGVAVPHGGLVNLVDWHLGAYPLDDGDRCPHLAGQAFDASVWEIWPVLAAGAALHLPDDETRATPELLRDWLCERGVTVAFVPTPVTERLLPLDWPADCALHTMLTGGDALHNHPRPGLPFRLVNHYGPTENTVVASAGAVAPREPADGEEVPLPHIGRAIAGVRCLVLDHRMEPAPVGVPGELCVGGASLARGYLDRPGLTADRFVPDPFEPSPGARLYRTGDRVRWLPSGDLEFLGRFDFQVKVRGFRIELGEIESVLAAQPAVGQAVVVAVDAPGGAGEAGEKLLAAYWEPAASLDGSED